MKLNFKTINLFILAIIAFFSIQNTMAQKQFTLEDLNFGGVNYRNMIPQNKYFVWWGDELIIKNANNCAIVNKKTNKETILFTRNEINDAINKTLNKDKGTKHAFSYWFPYANKTIVFVNTSTNNFLYNWKIKDIEWKQTFSENSASEWSANSRNLAYVSNNNIFVCSNNGKTTQITNDGSADIVYGQAVHRDEFGIYKGLFWSNDGKMLAFYRMDQSMVEPYPQVNVFTPIATEETERYPMAGRTSHKVTIGIYNTQTNKTIYLNVGDPTNRYFTNIAWAPNGKTLYLIEINRKQTTFTLDAYDVASGNKIRTLYTEHSDKYVHPTTPITFLPWNENEFILQSQKSGYNHLYLFNVNGKEIKQLTSGQWLVMRFLGFNTQQKSVLIVSNECNPIQSNIFSVNISNAKRTLLDNGKGCHENIYTKDVNTSDALSVSGSYIIDNYTEPNVPRNINVVNTKTKETNSLFSSPNPWKEYNTPIFSSGTIKAADGKTDLFYRMVKPANFDETKKYPTIIYVYGGPGTRNVEARWHYMSRGWETYMAQKGYILFILDNRGSSNRGLEFEQATFHKLGIEEMKDQMKGVDFLKSLPYVDQSKIGVHGWSFGGFMAINLITTHSDVFKVAVAGGPVIDWKWYEVMYGERYMGTPQDNAEGYANSSLLPKAKNLKGKLQIIIGMNDPVVVPQHAENFLNECIKAGTQPDFFIYPGQGHNMSGHSSVHLHERISQYFDDYLK